MIGQSTLKMNERLHDVTQNRMLLDGTVSLKKTKLKKDTTNIFLIMVMVFNATFNNISTKLWQSVLLVEETNVPRENLQPATSH
jgi:hypothetical protein